MADRERIIDGRAIEPDDVVIGVASTGLHSNGYSLARRIVFDIAKHERDRLRRGAWPNGRRRPVDADANLRPPGPQGA